MYSDFEIKAYQIYVLEFYDDHDASMCPVCMEEFCSNELEDPEIRKYYEDLVCDSKPILGKNYERIVQEIEAKIEEGFDFACSRKDSTDIYSLGKIEGLKLAYRLIEDYKNWY